jgi:hypothetical protein
MKPGVADAEMEHLVNEKVDAFWKGIESGSNKRGQVSLLSRGFDNAIKTCADYGDLLRKAPQEIMVSGVYGRRGSSMGAVVRSSLNLTTSLRAYLRPG